MSLPEPIYPTTARLEQFNTAEAQENNRSGDACP